MLRPISAPAARLGAGLLVQVIAFAVLTACATFSYRGNFRASGDGVGTHGAPGPPTAAAAAGTVSTQINSVAGGGSRNVTVVSCSGSSCTVSLSGRGSLVQILGARIAFQGVRDGLATLRVGDQDVSCRAAQTVTPGSLTLRCTSVTADTVQFTASRR